MRYDPERDLPLLAREFKTLSPTRLKEEVLRKRNEKVSVAAISVYFKRHPELWEELNKEIMGQAPTDTQAVDQNLFMNGAFEAIPSVKKWLMFMNLRRRKNRSLNPKYVVEELRLLRGFCKRFDKHPDRLSFSEVSEGLMILEKDPEHWHWSQGKKVAGMCTSTLRRALKDFLKANERSGYEQIQVGKPSGFQHYNQLALDKAKVYEMLEWIKAKDFKVYVIDSIMYRHGLRINAVVTATVENFADNHLTVLEKFQEWKTFNLVKEVADLLKTVVAERTSGSIFEPYTPLYTTQICAKLNGEALRLFVPDLIKKFGGHINPNHVWRHLFMQEMMRVTDKNADLVAAMAQCTAQSLRESYGAITGAEAERAGAKYLPLLAQEGAKA